MTGKTASNRARGVWVAVMAEDERRVGAIAERKEGSQEAREWRQWSLLARSARMSNDFGSTRERRCPQRASLATGAVNRRRLDGRVEPNGGCSQPSTAPTLGLRSSCPVDLLASPTRRLAMTSLADSDPSAHSLASSLLHSLSTHLASADKTTESPLAFVSTLKQIQRLASSHVVAAKSETASVRLDMDRKGLDLMGLEYERKRIQSEIIRAQAFEWVVRSLDPRCWYDN